MDWIDSQGRRSSIELYQPGKVVGNRGGCMDIDDTFIEVRLAMGRGQTTLARTLLEAILLVDPQNQRARHLLSGFGVSSSKSAPTKGAQAGGPMPSNAGAKGKVSKSKRKRAKGSTICPICKSKIRPGKMAIHNEY
jgi:hypothetical protein